MSTMLVLAFVEKVSRACLVLPYVLYLALWYSV